MSIRSVFACILLVCATSSTAKNRTNGAIGFPEVEENPDLRNKDNRKPVFIPAMCPANELYYPGDQKDDWICDCRPAFLYHPASDSCWPAYQRGPCPTGQYLVLPQNSVIPVCEDNPCQVDGYITWNGNCARLGSTAPCNYMYPVPAVLGVNATSLVVSCVRLTFEGRLAEMPVPTPPPACPPGCKRSVNGKCVPGI